MSTKQQHTPTPWRNRCFQILNSDGSRIAHTGMGQLPPSRSNEAEANAEFIVRACNAHDDLLAALIGVVRVADRATVEFDAARAAIAKARGKGEVSP